MSDHGERWLDEDAGPIVPAYALTRGRAKPSGNAIDLIAVITATGRRRPGNLGPEQLTILELATRATPLADIASELSLPIGVVRVLVGDLRDQQLVTVRPPAPAAQLPHERLLREVINGLRAL
ncbi:DUF742 domain-containing protein [Sinosporangium siamense]|uniref:DUF742 domain-containing protein n=1 Tax=Sinosporangium siamense TaxID=1367973 RepID=A0A919VB87_9ACTN|nr:DUF742 domain-containing protein [Sinosporangium siamense]GII91864.1 hypothetical protein Ssi02_20950 [Sinosporangium siamense]